jgi:sugar (pentulose or hexulose) kinase
MLFRPEEMDPASGIGPIFSPFFNRDVDITMYVIRAVFLYDSIADNDAHMLSAVQTGSIDLN